MARQRKPYTYTTRYGRKKILEEARKYNATLPKEEKEEAYLFLFYLLAGVGIILLIIYFGIKYLVDIKYSV
ncbi:hypothetical protein [Sphingobacterium sp. 1.A.5]|uniref:hypothetical protein n=1 Tax=Sphingobacterium sp. 1.A.5 TaxID=2044604 RepID=UPI000C0BBDCE|nr:hypothetical protein [Sphingobacterium sp. 1.A.5]